MTETADYDGPWKNMAIVYQKMGLSEKEIQKRILCKTAKVLDIPMNLNSCDGK